MHDHYHRKSYERNLLVTEVRFATPVDIIWLLTQIFVAVMFADKELMICLNRVILFEEDLTRKYLSMSIITKQYVYFWKNFVELRSVSEHLKDV